MIEPTAKAKGRHYVIVVHGMSVEKESETAFEVIHGFAEVRSPNAQVIYRNLLPPTLSSQSVLAGKGHGWAEFRGIPIDPSTIPDRSMAFRRQVVPDAISASWICAGRKFWPRMRRLTRAK